MSDQVTIERTQAPAGRRRPHQLGHVAAAVLVLGAAAAVLAGAGGAVQLLFPLAGVGCGIVLLERRRHEAFVVLVCWLWFLAPFVRRLVDWSTGRTELSLVLLAPALVALVALPYAWSAARSTTRHAATPFAAAFAVLGYGGAVGLLGGRTVALAADLLQLLPPVVVGLLVLGMPDRDRFVRDALVELATYALLVLGLYGVVQFLLLPEWDALWMLESGITTVGRAEPGQVRVFGTLNTAGPLAHVLTSLVLVAGAGGQQRPALRTACIGVGLVALGLTQVRAAWLGLAVGCAVLVRAGRLRPGRLAVVAVPLVLLVGTVGGVLLEQVAQRVEETVDEGVEDDSLTARLRFQGVVAGEALTDPVGDGLGATGLAAGLSGDAPREVGERSFVHFDSGVFERLTSLGAVAGLLLLGVTAQVVARGVGRVRAAPPALAGVTAAASALLTALLFTDVYKSATGALLWVFVALLAGGGDTARARSA